ncbi:HAD-IC family P-type ATPase [Sulfurospirillum diekertiae]|uniref:HAD-IC family P-type ATPase n=1 Tax=Sulfurospirillum diekertiae TaxID=1854492 RepID=UPI00351071AF
MSMRTRLIDLCLYALVNSSNHPISQGVARFLNEDETTLHVKSLEQIKTVEAKGVRAVAEGHELLGGNAKMMEEAGIEVFLPHGFESLSHYFFAIDGKLMAIFGLKDALKEGAKESIGALKSLGLEIVMLSGDHAKVTQEIAEEVGIETYKAGLFPHEKAAYIEVLRQKGQKSSDGR